MGGLICGIALAATAATAADVALTVEEPGGVARAAWPVTGGVPFGSGDLFDAKALGLWRSDGTSAPLQTDVLARWPDGSVRWLLVDFQADLSPGQKAAFRLRHKSGPMAAPAASPLRVTESTGSTVIVTGPLRIELTREGFDPLGAVWLDRNRDGNFAPDERVTQGGGGLFLRDAQGRRFDAARSPVEIAVEEAGPLRACVRITGTYAADDGTLFRHIVRLHAFAGRPYVRCFHTFVNDRQDTLMAGIKELGVTVRLADSAGPAGTAALGGHPAGGGRILQIDETRYELDGRPAGTRARGWAVAAGTHAGFATGVREFWQQWPKSVEARNGEVTLGLCPDFPAALYDGKPLAEENKLYYALRGGLHTFKIGMAKTHEIWTVFFSAPAEPASLDAFFQSAEEPLLPVCTPVYAGATQVAGRFPAADTNRYAGYDAWFERSFAGHLKLRDRVREYGMLNFGDWFGERGVNWGNLEYDLQHGLLMQYLRTGDRRYFLRGAQAARHHIDVDVVHAVNPLLKNPYGPPPRIGEIWVHALNHTGGYYTHAPLPVDRTYQMGYSANFGHVWITGDLDYYFLTGDRRAREVALMAADAMAAAPTPKVGTHIRSLGWPTILVLSAYEATGEPRYLESARKNWEALRQALDPQRGWVVKLAGDHCLHPPGSTPEERATKYRDQRCEGNVPFMEGLTVCALSRLHRHTGDPEVLKAIGAGIDQMIRECWQEDVKTFRYTACPLSSKAPYGLFLLSVEAMAYEARLTGNREHLRILREGFRAAIQKSGDDFGKSLGQMTFFAPHALEALD